VSTTTTPSIATDRDARFTHDGKGLVALSDESGEVEAWQLPANGVGSGKQLTRGATVLIWEAIPSPDGRWLAHHDKRNHLRVLDTRTGDDREVDTNRVGQFTNLAWSADSRWLAYVAPADNQFSQVKLYGVESKRVTAVTSDRYDSYSPAWSPDGKWLYLLSDRNLVSVVGAVWGSYQPAPYLDKRTEIFELPLVAGTRSRFAPEDELAPAGAEAAAKPAAAGGKPGAKGEKGKGGAADGAADASDAPPRVVIDLDGLAGRLRQLPFPAGNYTALQASGDALYWLTGGPGAETATLMGAKVTNRKPEAKAVTAEVVGYELSLDGKTILVRKDKALFLVDAAPDEAKLDDAGVDLSGWALPVRPREEWRQMFEDAWRLERDYFYDPGMHGVDWKAMREKYRPLVDRVRSREDLSDLLAQMVSELSALHIFVEGGDARKGPDDAQVSSLGAVLERDEAAGGFRVRHVYRHDPDQPERAGPLSRPEVAVVDGDLLLAIDGTSLAAVQDVGALLRRKAGKQVLVRVRAGAGGKERDVVVVPVSLVAERNLRYSEWELTRREQVERLSQGTIGYVHLRAMGGGDYTAWAEGFFPAADRAGLVIDVRHNSGGNIDSWILGQLLRKAWAYWSQPTMEGPAARNMQWAFRGHVVVLVDADTSSDGELFAEGFRRLGLGKVIGTRTWGGEIWLTSSNFLVDRGIATAAEFGVYGPQGEWLIEGHGVDPDMVVDNAPHATFGGRDAQLEAAVAHLQQRIREEPVAPANHPPYPDKSH
jgi:tricorn protease